VQNNPLRFTDPTGHRTTGECGLGGEQCAIYTPSEIVKNKEKLKCNGKSDCNRKNGHLARQLEDYLQTHPGYDPLFDRSEYSIMADDRDFKLLRGLYWRGRLKGSSSSADTPLLLYQYYDLEESISYVTFEWDSTDIDWSAVAIDAAATLGSFVGLNSAINASKFGPFLKGYNFAFGTWSVQHTASKSGLKSADTVLSSGGLIPGPTGTIFSASSLISDLLGGLHQGSTPYIPSIPRNSW
jgi:hypothetical protein